MKKIINNPENVVAEMSEGMLAAFCRDMEAVEGVNGVRLKNNRKNKVNLILGGGSGHEPLFGGFIGKGLADASCNGNIFTSPNPETIYETALSVHEGKGILFLYGNYAGDNMNFDIAEEMLNEENIETAHIRVWDDCASAPRERITDRRGIAGDVFVVKIAGAACDAGHDLSEVLRISEKARDNTTSIGIATSPGRIPGLAKPTFEIGEDEIEFGMGIHGEPGIQRTKMMPADEMVAKMYELIKSDSGIKQGDEVCVLVNGLGSTTMLEMYIVNRKLTELLNADGISIYDTDINSYCTCQEMGGFSISFLKLDDELKKYYNEPCFCPFYAKEKRS